MVKHLRLVLGMGILFIGLIYLYTYNPSGRGLYPPCPFYYLTGYYCPGCGSLRAIHQTLHGHILTAMGLNPMMVISLPLIVYLLISQLNIKVRGRLIFPRVLFPPVFYKVLLGLILVYWILRNIPISPFLILAP